MDKVLRKRLMKLGIRPYRRIGQIHVSDVLTVMESFFGEKLASMTDQEIKEAVEYVIEKLRLSWASQIKAAFDDCFKVKASNREGKLWNVPDAEYEELSAAWKIGDISDADFTEKLHEKIRKGSLSMSTTVENKTLTKVINGTAYHAETPDQVVQWLETSRERGQRIRIFLGDAKTGRDRMEEYNTIGTVGRSYGELKVPLMIANVRSHGGGQILDHCIVRITTKDSKGNIYDVYRHSSYHLPKFVIQASGHKNYPVGVWLLEETMQNVANFKTKEQAERWILFIKGERNSK